MRASARPTTEPDRRAIAFLGPSLDREDAARIWNIRYFPPVGRGELVDIVRAARPAAVLIIDGYFLHRRAVLHREIVHVLRAGVAVYGAASMGALRACELHTEGMVGLGTVYDWYRTGVIDGDDEVAVLHSPAPPFEPVVIPCVNFRYAVQQALRAGAVTPDGAAVLTESAKSLHYSERTLERILASASPPLPPPALARFHTFFSGQERQLDLKRTDASFALETLRASTEREQARVDLA